VRTLGITLQAPQDVVAGYGRPVPDGQMELDVGADGLPTALRLHVAAGDESFDLEVRFSDWGSPVDIEVPAAVC
jgi:hypothetical protein